jgi:glycosyltransferase involved in cell wall biosynthesis
VTARRVGLIARADSGGLGNITAEFCRHLHPDATVVVDWGEHGRGPSHLERYEASGATLVNPGPLMDDQAASWLLRRCDVLYTAETAYRPSLWDEARTAGVRTVLHAMPEYLHPADPGRQADEVWLPTSYGLDHVPGARVVPVPVALDRFTYRQRTEAARTFAHVGSGAAHDRNGSALVIGALPHITHPITLVVRGADLQHVVTTTRHAGLMRVVGDVTVELDDAPVEDYWQLLSDDVDVLVMPRRYAGLSMPMQEAAAAGIPTVALDVEPCRDYCHPELLVPPTRSRSIAMRGGRFPIAEADPAAVANVMNRLASDAGLMAEASEWAFHMAGRLSWASLRSRYQTELATA